VLAVNGTGLFIKRMGGGEPVVVIHGGPVLEHSYLLPHLAPLAEWFELIFYDQRLSGRSAGQVDSASVSLSTFIDDIEAIRQALGLGAIHLMGHSWGGLLAMRYAIGYPERLRSLVLVSSMSASSELWQQEEARLFARRTVEDSIEFATIRASEEFASGDPDAIASILRVSFKVQFHDPSKIAGLELFVPEDYGERSRQFGYLIGDLTNFDFHEELQGVTVRTLLVYGAAEPSLELGGAALHEHLPNAELVTIQEAGHFPFIEQPTAFLETVRNFLRNAEH
jgi:proline iminopeptidase